VHCVFLLATYCGFKKKRQQSTNDDTTTTTAQINIACNAAIISNDAMYHNSSYNNNNDDNNNHNHNQTTTTSINIDAMINSQTQTATTSSLATQFQLPMTCPKPLVMLPEYQLSENNADKPHKLSQLGSVCSLPCKSIGFTQREYAIADTVTGVCTILSMLGCVFLLATYCGFKKKRQQRIIVYIVFSVSILALIQLIFFIRRTITESQPDSTPVTCRSTHEPYDLSASDIGQDEDVNSFGRSKIKQEFDLNTAHCLISAASAAPIAES
jgi:hypothetical protein